MGAIGARNTAPELSVRRALHAAGLRFRIHRRDLPGSPDVVLPRFRAVVLVHGCFWHRHPHCRFATTPSSNVAFWSRKFRDNVERDQRQRRALKAQGWRVFVVWECQSKNVGLLARLVERIRGGAPGGV